MNSADSKAITDLLALAPGGKVPIEDASYVAEYDVDRSGVIDSDDAAIVSGGGGGGSKVALPSGRISATGSDGPDNVIGYAGYVYNRESGLYTVRFRHYDPQTGRFLEPDPAGYVDGTNLYQYVLGNPLGFTDPMGLWHWRDAADGIGVIVDSFTGDAAEEDQEWLNAVERTSANRRAQICQLYREGKISAEEAARMLAAEEGLVGDAREGLTGIVEAEVGLLEATGDAVAEIGLTLATGGVAAVVKLTAKLASASTSLVRASAGLAVAARKSSVMAWVGGKLVQAGRFFYDARDFKTISRTYWAARGGANGKSLHHWLFPQRWKWVPLGIRNAGFNLVVLPALKGVFHRTLGWNQWMGLAVNWGRRERLKSAISENTIRVALPGLAGGVGYGSYWTANELYAWLRQMLEE